MKAKRLGFVMISLFVFMLAMPGSGNAYISDDQNLSDFPPWIWPIIMPVQVISKVISTTALPYDQAAAAMKEAVLHQCESFKAGNYEFKELLAMVDAQFEIQLIVLKSARTKVAGFGLGDMIALDDDDWCGTPPKPRPWPPYLLDLVKLQVEVFRTELAESNRFTKTEMALLDADLNGHLKNFALALQ